MTNDRVHPDVPLVLRVRRDATPDWAVMFDQDPEMARATRHRVLDMVSAEKMQVGFYHANFPATGFITREGDRYNLVPAAWKLPV